MQHGDILLHEKLSTLGEQFADHELDALVMHAGHWSHPSDRARSIDCYLIGAGVYPDLRRQAAPLGDALARLRATGARIQERDVEACLPCRGGTDALLGDQPAAARGDGRDQRGERVFDSEIQGRVALDPSAEVHDSLIRGPVAIGPRARITNAYIGPYTSIGADVQIDCVEIEHSIVLDRAQLRFARHPHRRQPDRPRRAASRATSACPQAIRLVGRRGRRGRDLVNAARQAAARCAAGHRHRARTRAGAAPAGPRGGRGGGGRGSSSRSGRAARRSRRA